MVRLHTHPFARGGFTVIGHAFVYYQVEVDRNGTDMKGVRMKTNEVDPFFQH
jgi:hypothetical protein